MNGQNWVDPGAISWLYGPRLFEDTHRQKCPIHLHKASWFATWNRIRKSSIVLRSVLQSLRSSSSAVAFLIPLKGLIVSLESKSFAFAVHGAANQLLNSWNANKRYKRQFHCSTSILLLSLIFSDYSEKSYVQTLPSIVRFVTMNWRCDFAWWTGKPITSSDCLMKCN